MKKKLFIHEIKLTDKDEFSKRFNTVSDLFNKAMKEDTKEAWQEYSEAKYAIEQGLPMCIPEKSIHEKIEDDSFINMSESELQQEADKIKSRLGVAPSRNQRRST